MVEYIGIEGIQRIVGRLGPAPFIEGLAAEIETDYRRWGEFDKSARHAIHSPGGVIELMPTSDGEMYSFKYVNGHPKNTALGLLTVTAFGVLADVETGYPLLLSELTVTTALRTAAMSALAARWMARPDSRVMALIGNGAQSEFQAIAFHHMLGIREFRLYDVDGHATEKLARNLHALGERDLQVKPCRSAAEAVEGADIVTTVTADKCNAIILTPEMIAPGMHLNAVGGDCPGKTELHADILRRVDARVIVEYEPQSRIEGEIQQLPADFSVTEFTQVLSGVATGRASPAEVTIFDSVGFALEDYSALRYLYKLQRQQNQPRKIDLIPHLDNPKNLFGLLGANTTRLPATPSSGRPLRSLAVDLTSI
ncbi:MAG TPA: ornithine cyclodeaminase [Polaromonas sp.]|uniref:ornithine cyclodeaminase n=1 Tax=Polaromonas sp. UBA4122 TaxID=1947074 RepID=UPI000EDBB10C|nr:ornithine cyclodeaminase [Polaromonas sp. UBA4122]HAL36753.1 ornithine cyclodeaminase [Polaromonas sp.]